MREGGQRGCSKGFLEKEACEEGRERRVDDHINNHSNLVHFSQALFRRYAYTNAQHPHVLGEHGIISVPNMGSSHTA